MGRHTTRQEHPIGAVFLHWMHLIALGALVYTGLEIHELPFRLWNTEPVGQSHILVALVFLATLLIRLLWAFLSDGSASKGSTELVGDWRHFGCQRGDLASTREWLSYYVFLRKERPHQDKYNPLQRGVYVLLFPLAILWMLLTGLALSSWTSTRMAPFAALLGGAQGTRIAHYDGMLVLIALTTVHLYAALLDGWPTVANMLLCWAPKAGRGDPLPLPSEPAVADAAEHLDR